MLKITGIGRVLRSGQVVNEPFEEKTSLPIFLLGNGCFIICIGDPLNNDDIIAIPHNCVSKIEEVKE